MEVGVEAMVGVDVGLADLVLCLGFLAGASMPGGALAAASGVIVAFWVGVVTGVTRCGAAVDAELFLTADPIANAAPSPSTSATASGSGSQRWRTS